MKPWWVMLLLWGVEDLEAAKRYFDAGSQAYERSRYEAAIAAFEAAYDLAPRPALAFSMAQAYRLQYFLDRDPKKLIRAVDLYKRYLAEDPNGRRRRDAVDHLATLEPIVLRMEQEERLSALRGADARRTQLMVATEVEGAEASVDGGPMRPAPYVTEVGPGEHQVRIQATGHAARTVRIQAVQGRLVVVDGNLDPLPARLSVEGEPRAFVSVDGRPAGRIPVEAELPAGRHWVTVEKRGAKPQGIEVDLDLGQADRLQVDLEPTAQRRWAWAVGGLALGLTAAGGATLGVALGAESEAQDLEARRQTQGLTPAERQQRADALARRDDFRWASALLLGGAGVAILTSVGLFLFDRPKVPAVPIPSAPPPRPLDRLQLGLGPGQATFTARF